MLRSKRMLSALTHHCIAFRTTSNCSSRATLRDSNSNSFFEIIFTLDINFVVWAQNYVKGADFSTYHLLSMLSIE